MFTFTTHKPGTITVLTNASYQPFESYKGSGWISVARPVDIVLITDRSYSMDDYATMVYPDKGGPLTGTLPQADREYLIATYDNRQYAELEFMLSSPYTDFDKGSYYYDVKIIDPDGDTYYCERSLNENSRKLEGGTFSTTRTGAYKVYAKAAYSARGGMTPYSFSVLTTPSRLESAKTAATQLAGNMTDQDQMGLVSFCYSSTLNAGLMVVNGSNKTRMIGAINGLYTDSSTRLSTGIQTARQEFAAHGRGNARHVAILLTDGYSQSPDEDIAGARDARDDGIVIFTIGMGMADENALASIANMTGGQYCHVVSELDLAGQYQQIFNSVSSDVTSRYSRDIKSTRQVNDTSSNLEGFDIELMGQICNDLGVRAEYSNAGLDSIVTDIAAGKYDCSISAITITPGLQDAVDFSDPYYESKGQVIMTRANSPIRGPLDLVGRKVGAQKGTPGYYEVLNASRINPSDVFGFDTLPDTFLALQKGEVDAVAGDYAVLYPLVRNSSARYAIAPTYLSGTGHFGIAVNKDNDGLTGAINQALKNIKADGRYKAIYDRWFS